MTDIDTSAPVMVTGATGYVAGWIIKRLLDAGCTVHAPVRNPDRLDKLRHLSELADRSSGEIRFFRADLLEQGSYDAAMQGCAVVFHTASPFTMDVKDPQTQLVDPAVNGTKNVLASVNRTGSVKRVVLTSSYVAIFGDNADLASLPGQQIDETRWNTSSSLEHMPYSYSKTLAEQAAWEMADAQKRWQLVVINPAFVIGPSLNEKPTSESFNLIGQMGDGTMKMGVPHWGVGVVDVRDLADAHVAAGFEPAANGRNIICGHDTDFLQMSKLLKKNFVAYPVPTRVLPKWFVWAFGPMAGTGMTRKMIAQNVGHAFKCDNSKAKQELGQTYRPMEVSLKDMFQQMIDEGMLKRT
ncbi:aldehyde reductase [Roseibium sp. RKSG952]|uniref:SDR family oxidoreductase n=1 Tax=Roseibium sp. RKSG952 TaxID=2529384 RepID=UPI0012BB5A8B|nr:aldehyde reductase [Roseibium sp. RKSG952]MTH97990.1 aldehyde reductase [Roseibium sp. RKSG952]